jgi:hypothetical protein
MTDFAGFERLATDVMYLEGWTDIRPLGGVTDLGQDAVSEKMYRPGDDVKRTVFQYTLQEYLPGKVNDTIDKLNDNKIEFVELVIVTPHAISSEAQIRMKQDARSTHGISLNIYERKTLASRLADLQNGIFHRYFQDIKAQLDDVSRAASKGLLPEPLLERALLQASLALTFRPDSQRARKSVFDYFVLALILAEPNQIISYTDAAARATAALKSKKDIPEEQIIAAVNRLAKVGLVESKSGVVTTTDVALADVASGTVRLNEATSNFAADMVSAVRSALKTRLSAESERRIARNTREVLLEIVRSRGTAAFGDQLSSIDERVAALAKQQLDAAIGNALTAAFADALRAPSKEQANTLARWTQAYLAFAVMGLDPALNAFQASQFNKKIFILDTDVVLDAIVGDGLRSAGIRSLIESLARMGSRIVIPESVLIECIGHAQWSPKTYGYFGRTLLQLTPTIVEQKVWNVFVKGYYYAQHSGRISPSISYTDYLSNFYEARNPQKFLRDVIAEILPEGVEVVPLEKIRPDGLTNKEIENFAGRLQTDLAGSNKSIYRTEEDEAKLALIDATLFLTALRMNANDESSESEVLGGTCYLVTETSRYTRVARSLGIHATVTARPSALANVQELLGTFEVSDSDFVQLFDNPFLETAVDSVWPDLEKLVRSGVSLRGKSLPRLRFDLDDALHAHIVSLSESEDADERDEAGAQVSDTQYIDLLNVAVRKGYSLIPEVATIRTRIESSEQRVHDLTTVLDEVNAQNQVLQEQIAFFGKRRQRYLRRVERTAAKSK